MQLHAPRWSAVLCLTAFALPVSAQHATEAAASPQPSVDYLRDVRPILTQHCYGCHGPDDETRETDIRFDQRESLLVDLGEGRPAIQPGNLEASEVWLRIHTEDEDIVMPPKEADDPLSPEQVDILKRWIQGGAQWEDHWAFTPPKKAPVPEAGDGWAENVIDRFVAAHHATAGVQPAARADKEALIRRLSFDLTGLPPSPEEIDKFVEDEKDGAYERLVDRLLESERYGEHQAQFWLDLARYADSNGYQRDGSREAWKWREWVIEAFNKNKPFDQFAVEQLAGDLFEKPTLEQQIATGFNRNHPTNSEAGEEPDEYRTKYVMDRVDATATTFLGLTVACAQCHDHKFDPISQKDYYRFYAFFNQVEEKDSAYGFGGSRNAKPSMRIPNADQQPHMDVLKARIEELKQRIEGEDPFADAAQPKWEEKARSFVGEDITWKPARPIGMLAHQGSILERQDDGSILATGEAPVRDTYDLTFKPGKGEVSAIRIEVLPPEGDEGAMSGRSRKGQFILSGLKVRLSSLSDSEDPPLVFIAKADTDLRQERPKEREPDSISPGNIEDSIIADDKQSSGSSGRRFGRGGWSIIGDERLERHEAVLVPLETLKLNDSSVIRVTLEQNSRPYKTLISRFRVSFANDERLREYMLPAYGDKWSAVGPFPAKDVAKAYSTDFEPEKELKDGVDLKKTYEKPVVPKEEEKGKGEKGGSKGSSSEKGGKPDGKSDGKPGKPEAGKPQAKPEGKPDGKPAVAVEAKPDAAMPDVAKPDAAKPQAGGGKKPSGKKFGGKKYGGKKFGGKKPSGGGKPDGAEVAKGDGASKPDAAGEKPAAKPEGGKPEGDKPEGGKPVAKPVMKKKPATKPDAKPEQGGSQRRQRKPEKLAWKEHHEWRDGKRISLADGNVAWYLTRKLHSTKPRTVKMRFDSAPGVKAWLNGELIYSKSPPDPSQGRSRSRGGDDDREVVVGLRAGESELVTKVVFGASRSRGRGRSGFSPPEGVNAEFFANLSDEEIAEFQQQMGRSQRGGGSFTFDMTPDGEDVMTYEVVAALRELPGLELAAAEQAEKAKATEATSKRERGGPMGGDGIESGETKVAPRLAKLRDKVKKFYRGNIDTVGKLLRAEKEKLERELRRLEQRMPETMVMKDLEKEKMRKTHMFIRGDYKQKGEEVDAGVPSVLPPMPDDLPRNRLGLAKWIVSSDNPLTARVAVNRVWQQYFGTGFVTTPEDFGLRGGLPSHPELLDWLARDFVDGGWDMKKLHKSIVMSATYRQSAKMTSAALEKDPDNTHLARGPRQRLSAEMVRDNALAVSGLLVEEVGGRSVRPYQPAGLWSEVASGQRYRRDKGEKQYRRGLYVYWKRGAPYPSMTTFDAAKREVCVAQRAETTTPLQALVLLNDPVYVEAAKMLGQRMIDYKKPEVADKLGYGFRLCAGRAPSETELDALTALLVQQRKHYAADEEAAKKLLGVGDAKVDTEKYEESELAAWAAVGSALLNMDATIHR